MARQRHKQIRKRQDGTVSLQELFGLANTLHTNGNSVDAIRAYREYLKHCPGDKYAHYNLAVSLRANGQMSDAMASYADALRLDPAYPEALNNLGNAFHHQGELEQARLCFEQALRARPDFEEAEYNLANSESEAGLYENAILRFSRILERNPAHPQAWNNLGRTLLLLRQPQESLPFFERALQLWPEFSVARWNSSVAQLTLGDFAAGWSNFEHRSAHKYAAFPRWNGTDLTGQQILIHAEQGFGDTIQFVRYCPLIKAFGGKVILECQPELVDLLDGMQGIDQLLPSGSAVPAFDCQIPLMSVPRVLGTTVDTIPRIVPYLKARQSRDWERELQAPPNHLKVGLVWAGSTAHHNDRNRSIPPRLLSALGQPENVSFYSLQQKPHSASLGEIESLRFAGSWDSLTFEDTAAILTHLDLLISVDTSAAHLAGALGRPVWTLLPYVSDWRWLLDRSDTPWYPTMRLFRQPQLRDWNSVLQHVGAELRRRASAGSDGKAVTGSGIV
jgi:Tfp pilus assembly protein PilF